LIRERFTVLRTRLEIRNFFMRSKACLFPLFFWWMAFSGCDGFFPTQSKPYVPKDHTADRTGFLHAPDLMNPLDAKTGCKAVGCHGSDLKGSVAVANGRKIATPSCYQCHGALWEGNGGGREDD